MTSRRRLALQLARRVASGSRRLAAQAHRLQLAIEWREPAPEWFDHLLDVYYQWPAGLGVGASFLERGVFGSLAVPHGGCVLELACGDGFNAARFYAERAGNVIALDADPEAVAYARRVHARGSRLTFVRGDVRQELPRWLPWDVIALDGALEHLTEAEQEALVARVAAALEPGGVFVGYTVTAPPGGGRHLAQHEHEPASLDELAALLRRHFAHATVWQTSGRGRVNLYWHASDTQASLPLTPAHPGFRSF